MRLKALMGLFQHTKYFLTNSLPLNRQEQLEYALSKNGAIKADSIASATHIITNSAHFDGCEAVKEGVFIVSVSICVVGKQTLELTCLQDYWVDRSLVLGKLQAYVPLLIKLASLTSV